jgi:hypothetical protein
MQLFCIGWTFNPPKHSGMTTYTQHVVCTGMKAQLRKIFPEANSHHAHACLRCQLLGKKRTKPTDLCRFQGRLVEMTSPTLSNLCQLSSLGFRHFSLQDREIVVAFDDATPVTLGSRLPPICNQSCDLATLRQLQVETLVQHLPFCS